MNAQTLISYKNYLNRENNEKTVRRIVITKDGVTKCKLDVSLRHSKPFITTPSDVVLSDLILFDVKCELGKYKDYLFKEGTITSLINSNLQITEELKKSSLTQEEKTNYISSRCDIHGDAMSEDRYIPYVTVFNPILKTDMTVLIDKLHGDMFYISGLSFLLDSEITVDSDPINIEGYAIGCQYNMKQDATSFTPSNVYKYDKDASSYFSCNIKTDKTALHNEDPDVKAYGVAFTKELPSNISQNNFPIIYDKVVGRGGVEVQVCRQDAIPSVVVQLGKVEKFFQDSFSNKSVFSWIIYCSNLKRVNIKPNEMTKNPKTIISVIFDLY